MKIEKLNRLIVTCFVVLFLVVLAYQGISYVKDNIGAGYLYGAYSRTQKQSMRRGSFVAKYQVLPFYHKDSLFSFSVNPEYAFLEDNAFQRHLPKIYDGTDRYLVFRFSTPASAKEQRLRLWAFRESHFRPHHVKNNVRSFCIKAPKDAKCEDSAADTLRIPLFQSYYYRKVIWRAYETLEVEGDDIWGELLLIKE
jgi:hypothetical protein